MKKIISFTCAVILTVVSYGYANEAANKIEETASNETVAVENVDVPAAEKATPNKAVASNASPAPTQYRRAYTRQEIRSMNILDRPNRPGHFYGNAVRRRHGR